MSQQGPRWAFMRWLKLNNPDGSKYMDRLRIVQTPWFGLYLHWIYTPDEGRDLHDHPWWFFSFLLKGRYTEEVGRIVPDETGATFYRWLKEVDWINFKPAVATKRISALHRIVSMTKSPVVSLVFVGPRVREWGFVQADGSWIRAEDYHIRGDGSIKVG